MYKEATNEEVTEFINQPFIELVDDYNAEKVSKPNRKRIGLAIATLAKMTEPENWRCTFISRVIVRLN